MIKSMTGFGKSTGDIADTPVTVEVSTVNHRFLDAHYRLPYEWNVLEARLREVVGNRLVRGKLNVNVSRKRGQSTAQRLKLDAAIARQYLDASRQLGELAGKTDTLSVDILAQLPGVFVAEEREEDAEQAEAALIPLLEQALEQLDTMRAAEGAALAREIRHRIELIREAVARIKVRLPELNEHYETKLRERMRELTEESALAEERIVVEVAMLADKGDVTEEIVRLEAHLDHALQMMDADEPAGRKLNFLTQEIQREMNTLSAKIRDTDVVRDVLEMKSELEKIREQGQNIE